jgi:hypothetical protein
MVDQRAFDRSASVQRLFEGVENSEPGNDTIQ